MNIILNDQEYRLSLIRKSWPEVPKTYKEYRVMSCSVSRPQSGSYVACTFLNRKNELIVELYFDGCFNPSYYKAVANTDPDKPIK